MTHSEEPGATGDGVPATATWHWRLLTAQGTEASLAETAAVDSPRFESQGDAELWVQEAWPALADQGVASVVLLDGDREVYGPMGLGA